MWIVVQWLSVVSPRQVPSWIHFTSTEWKALLAFHFLEVRDTNLDSGRFVIQGKIGPENGGSGKCLFSLDMRRLRPLAKATAVESLEFTVREWPICSLACFRRTGTGYGSARPRNAFHFVSYAPPPRRCRSTRKWSELNSWSLTALLDICSCIGILAHGLHSSVT